MNSPYLPPYRPDSVRVGGRWMIYGSWAVCGGDYCGPLTEGEGVEAHFQPDTLTVTSYKASLRQKKTVLTWPA